MSARFITFEKEQKMKAREQVIRNWLDDNAVNRRSMVVHIALVAAKLAPSIGYDASRRMAVKMGCPVGLWRVAYLCEMGK